eukprot:TRINITY_DN12680_c0_g2_i1.p1 TRINITY_DN12680_c0_g2~~TRINITY_DN12680_c0_g2_i1.p1  ORF type:complete len:912 (-),score=148.71 TRINITY_DN12680_c0_g2_i1:42-2723(-)
MANELAQRSQRAPRAAGLSRSKACCSETLCTSRGYSSLRVLGRGSFGVAMLVRDADGNERVVKGVDLSQRSEKHRLAAAGEAEVMQRLRHPYIVRFRESFMEEDTLAIVMDFAGAGDLRQQVRTAKLAETILPENSLIRWITQALLGVRYMHNLNILHRDLKSENLFLETMGHLRIGDFGISCIVSNPEKPFVEKKLVGTPYYLAPEICSLAIYSGSSDIWAVGCVLFELAALTVPFTGNSLSELMTEIKSKTAPPLPEHYSSELAALCRALLNSSRFRRPSASSVLQRGILRSMVEELLAECHQTGLSINQSLATSPTAESSAALQACSPTVVIDSPHLRSEIPESLVDMKAIEAPAASALQSDYIGAGLHILELAKAIEVVQDRHGRAPQSLISDCALFAAAVEKHGYASCAERARAAPRAHRDASSMPPPGSRVHDPSKMSLPVGISSSYGHPLRAYCGGHATSEQAQGGYASSARAMMHCTSTASRLMADDPKHLFCKRQQEEQLSLDSAGAMPPRRCFTSSVAESGSPMNMRHSRDRHGDIKAPTHSRPASASPSTAVDDEHPDCKAPLLLQQPVGSQQCLPGHRGYVSSAGGVPARPLSASLGSVAGAPAKMLRSLKRTHELGEGDDVGEKIATISAGWGSPQLPQTTLARVERQPMKLPPHSKHRSSSSSALLRSASGLGPVPPLPPPLPLPPARRKQDIAEEPVVSKQNHNSQDICPDEQTQMQIQKRCLDTADIRLERRRQRVVPCPQFTIPVMPSLEHAGVPLAPARSSLDNAGRQIECSAGSSTSAVPKVVPPPLNLASIKHNDTGNLNSRRLPPSGRLSARSASARALSSALSSARRRLSRALSWGELIGAKAEQQQQQQQPLRPMSSRSPRRAVRLPLQR